MSGLLRFTDQEIRAARPPKNQVEPDKPYAFHVEEEYAPSGDVETVATLFLTNRECPFTCLMCDLWKNTTHAPLLPGHIPAQIDFALARLPPARHIKLYNSGNFFDTKAIPIEDYPAIAARVSDFKSVIVENHPLLCNDRVLQFRDLIETDLEVALGLETIHPQVLPRLNKQMTLRDFERAVEFLRRYNIRVRTFILLRPPFLNEAEGVDWANRSIRWAFDVGVECCSLVPTRGGNGLMEQLAQNGHFTPPTIESMETVLETGIAFQSGRVFMDLWDIQSFYQCAHCGPARAERIRTMNLTQRVAPPVTCSCTS